MGSRQKYCEDKEQWEAEKQRKKWLWKRSLELAPEMSRQGDCIGVSSRPGSVCLAVTALPGAWQ